MIVSIDYSRKHSGDQNVSEALLVPDSLVILELSEPHPKKLKTRILSELPKLRLLEIFRTDVHVKSMPTVNKVAMLNNEQLTKLYLVSSESEDRSKAGGVAHD